MLNSGRENLAAKLLLSSALVAVSVFYGWWQRHAVKPVAPPVRAMHRAPIHPLLAAVARVPAAPQAAHASVESISSPAPAARKSATVARTALQKERPHPALPEPPEAAPMPAPSPSAPLSAQAALAMYLPTEDASPPLPPVIGTPGQGAAATLPAGTRLADGDYTSDRHQFEWGDLKIKISIHGGEIVAVQVLQYPDHRSQSLYLSQLASPTLAGEVIKSQQAQVDIVSSATDTSYAFQDTIANAIMKATRGS